MQHIKGSSPSLNDKLKLINMRWNAYYYSCNQVPCKGCNLGLGLPETLAFFLLDAVLDAVRRRLPLDCELCEELDLSDRGLLWANDREVWGVTCSAGTVGGLDLLRLSAGHRVKRKVVLTWPLDSQEGNGTARSDVKGETLGS